MEIKYGHIYTADLNPQWGSEPGKMRPVLVVQSDLVNSAGHGSTLVCLLTSKIRKEIDLLRVHVKKGEAGLTLDSDIMIDQVRAIDNRRFEQKLGRLSPVHMEKVRERLGMIFEIGQ